MTFLEMVIPHLYISECKAVEVIKNLTAFQPLYALLSTTTLLSLSLLIVTNILKIIYFLMKRPFISGYGLCFFGVLPDPLHLRQLHPPQRLLGYRSRQSQVGQRGIIWRSTMREYNFDWLL